MEIKRKERVNGMDGQMDGQTCGRMDKWVSGWREGWMYWGDERPNKWTEVGRRNGQPDGWTRWTDGNRRNSGRIGGTVSLGNGMFCWMLWNIFVEIYLHYGKLSNLGFNSEDTNASCSISFIFPLTKFSICFLRFSFQSFLCPAFFSF